MLKFIPARLENYFEFITSQRSSVHEQHGNYSEQPKHCLLIWRILIENNLLEILIFYASICF